MKALLIALLAGSATAPAFAQHSDHAMPAQAPTPAPPPTPQAVEQPSAEDPHADHDMNAMPEAAPTQADPHAGHDMADPVAATPPAETDPHAGHAMPTTEPSAPAAQTDPHAGHDMSGMQPAQPDDHAAHGPAPLAPLALPERALPEEPPPAAAFTGPRHAANLVYDPQVMAEAREDLREDQGDFTTYWVMVDQLEAHIRDGRDGYLWDAQGWYGGDINKLWLKTEGEGTFGESLEDAEVQALYSRAITPWFDFQAGVRYDIRPDPERAHLVVGLQGLVPYMFEIDAAAFLSDEGDLTARFEAEYDQRITQRLILQPRVEFDLAAQDVPEIGVGSGFSSAELGLRLRYEFAREFAPYVGVEYERAFGDTADFRRAADENVGGWSLLVGIRTWF